MRATCRSLSLGRKSSLVASLGLPKVGDISTCLRAVAKTGAGNSQWAGRTGGRHRSNWFPRFSPLIATKKKLATCGDKHWKWTQFVGNRCRFNLSDLAADHAADFQLVAVGAVGRGRLSLSERKEPGWFGFAFWFEWFW